MSDLPDYNKISFPEMPPIPLEEVVPDASAEVGPLEITCLGVICIDGTSLM